jgi:hypothetical protein
LKRPFETQAVNSGTDSAITAKLLRFFMMSPGWGISPTLLIT